MANDLRESSPSSGSSRNPATRAVLLILAVVLVIAAIGGLWSSLMLQPEPSDRIPSQIGGLRLMRALTGRDALADLRQMHGLDLGLTGGYVAYYEKRATVWVGDTESEQQAQSLITAMTDRIGAGNRVFTNLRPVKIDGQDAYSVEGMGQQHFFYFKGKSTVWVAGPPGAEEAFVREALSRVH